MKVTLSPLVAVLAVSLFGIGHADAQVRVRGGVRVVTPRTTVAVAVGRPFYYRPYYRAYYRPFYAPYYVDPFFYGSYYRPFYWYPYAAVGYGPYDGGAAIRMQVMPRDTEVYIDNYFAGTVDDFDGMFQRLHLEPGAHDVTLYHDGYRTVRQRVYIQPSGTFRLRYNMVPLGPGEVAEPRPAEPPPPPQNAPGPPQAGPEQGPYPPEPPRGAYQPPPPPPGRAPNAPSNDSASLSIRVQPGNAEVFIDGERWEGPADSDRLVVQVSPGPHHIEVRHEGYRSYATDVNARPGDTSTLNISLSRQQ